MGKWQLDVIMSDIGTLLEDADTLFLLAVAFVLTSAMLFDCMTVSSYDSYICNSLRKTSTSKSCWFNHHSETLKRRSLFFLPGPRWLLGEYDSICFNLSHWRLHGSWSLRLHFLNRISIWYPAQILIKVREHYNCFTGLDGCNHKALVASCYLYFHWSLL